MSNILLILRHAKSLSLMDDFAQSNGLTMRGEALDPIEAADDVGHALDRIKAHLANVDAVALGTKVYDNDKETSRIVEFIEFLKDSGLRDDQPVCMTHLASFDAEHLAQIKRLHANTHIVEDDNIGRHGPERFGNLILDALKK